MTPVALKGYYVQRYGSHLSVKYSKMDWDDFCGWFFEYCSCHQNGMLMHAAILQADTLSNSCHHRLMAGFRLTFRNVCFTVYFRPSVGR
jgi:hypothetical protein